MKPEPQYLAFSYIQREGETAAKAIAAVYRHTGTTDKSDGEFFTAEHLERVKVENYPVYETLVEIAKHWLDAVHKTESALKNVKPTKDNAWMFVRYRLFQTYSAVLSDLTGYVSKCAQVPPQDWIEVEHSIRELEEVKYSIAMYCATHPAADKAKHVSRRILFEEMQPLHAVLMAAQLVGLPDVVGIAFNHFEAAEPHAEKIINFMRKYKIELVPLHPLEVSLSEARMAFQD